MPTDADDWHPRIHLREPQFAFAERACFWELAALASHAHPSVAAMARTLMAGQPVSYNGDPLRDHATAAFLDKFIAKKPKAHARATSVMAPLSTTMTAAAVGAAGNASAADVSSAAFAALAETQVQPDELFFHKFYTLQAVKARRAAAKVRAGSNLPSGLQTPCVCLFVVPYLEVSTKNILCFPSTVCVLLQAAKQKRKEAGEESDSEEGGEALSDDEDDAADAFLEKEEGVSKMVRRRHPWLE